MAKVNPPENSMFSQINSNRIIRFAFLMTLQRIEELVSQQKYEKIEFSKYLRSMDEQEMQEFAEERNALNW